MLLVSLPRRATRGVLASLAALFFASVALFGQTPAAVDGFEPDFNGNVYAVAVQPDGKIIVGGDFTHFRTREGFSISRNNLARLNPDGSLDAAFNPSPNGPVRVITLHPDGRILIGGEFGGLQPSPAPAAALAQPYFSRLNADGSLAPVSLNLTGAPLPGGGGFLRGAVYAIAVQPDGGILIGGNFGSAQPDALSARVTRNNLLRLTPAGTLDLTFDPNPNGVVLALAAHVDNKIVVGGGFTSFKEAQRSASTTRNRIARLNRDGTLDTEFNPNANNAVDALAIQRDGKIVLAGHFTTLQPPTDSSAATRNQLARLNADGTLDSEFYPNANGPVTALGLQTDGSIVIAGSFSTAWGRGTSSVSRANLARFGPDGSIDPYFNPGLNAQADAVAFQADGKIVVVGHFTRALPPGSAQALVRNHVARVNADGSLDASFELASGGRVLSAAQQSDGRLIIGGSFSSVSGATHNYLARLNTDGTADASYTPSLNGPVYATALEAGGKLLVGGAFTTITHARTGTDNRNHIARLNADGTPDSEFNPNIDGQVTSILVQSDGKIVVGGTFSTVQPIGDTTTTSRSNILRLNANGTLDTTFNPTANSSITSMVLQSDGKIIVAGSFTAFAANGATTTTLRTYVARLNADGTVDTTFEPAIVGSPVAAVALQSDGKVIIGGSFINVTPRTATEARTQNRIARLNADGTLDTTYNPNPNAVVLALAVQSDNKVIIGGDFTLLQPNGAATATLRQYAARLNTDGTVDSTFFLDLDQVAGNRVDLVKLVSNNQALIGGRFTSLETPGLGTRVLRPGFVRVNLTGTNATLDTAFNPGAGGAAAGTINGLAVQADNKVLAVGSFTDLGGAKTTNIARFNPEGGADLTFGTTLTTDGPVNAVVVRPVNTLVASTLGGFAWLNANGTLRSGFTASTNARISGRVQAAVVDSGGRLLIGGAFTNLSNATGGNLARFLPNGTLDVAFNPQPNGVVTGIVVQPDGKIIIIGAFTTVQGVSRNNIARLNDTGDLDLAFDPNASARINAIVRESDGRYLVGGAFTAFSPNGATTSTSRAYLARLNTDGTLDANYNPNPNGTVSALALQADGKVVAGGAFTTVMTNATGTTFTRNFAARFNTDGSLDQNFDPNLNGPVNTVAAAADGKFILGGAFTLLQPNINGTAQATSARNNLVRVNSDSRVDDTFDPNANGTVTTVAVQPDGSVVLTGLFTTLQPAGTTTAVARNHVARVSSTGVVDLNFNPDFNGDVGFVAPRTDGTLLIGGAFTGLQASGSIVVGGSFATIGGVTAGNLAALNDNGSVNATFLPRPNGAVNALLMQPDGKLVAGGAFTSISGTARDRIARFNADGTLETAFAPSTGSTILALGLQSDGRIIVGGRSAGTVAGGTLLRLNANGSVDGTFTAGTVGLGVVALAVQADNKILAVIEGSGVRHTLVRLNADGSNDATFTPVQNASGFFDSLAVQADGRIVVGGEFTSIAGANIARLARLNANGTVDTSFNPAPNGRVNAVALQADGRVVLGGNFTTVSGQPRVGIARVSAGGAATQTLTVGGDRRTVTWVRGGTTTELSGVTFERSADRNDWVSVGAGARIPGTANWQITNLLLPTSGVFYIRARGITASDGSSSGVVESVREFNFANPLGGPSTATSVGVATAASVPGVSAVWTIDPLSGVGTLTAMQIATESGATVENTVEIVVPSTAAAIAPNAAGWLSNLSTRGRVSASSPLVVGFAISGTSSRTILVRGIGPSLATFGVTDAATATRLEVLDSTGRNVTNTSGWDAAASAELISAFARTGAFPLPGRTSDSAALLTLQPGTYTLQVSAAQGSGTALAEIYDADSSTNSRLMNISTRGTAAAGNGALIGGFVISGNLPKRMLLRGAGPALVKFGLTGSLSDPSLALYDAQGTPLGANDNWASIAPQVVAAATSVGAFAFDAESRDAGVLATLPPGAYTVQLTPSASAAANASGTALIEIYELP